MNSNGLTKARNVLLVFQIPAALLVIIAAIVSLVSLDDVKTNYKSFDSFFGAVNAARVGAIIIFSISILIVIITYFMNFGVGKSVGGAVISTVMFILNFVLIPFSSKQELATSLANRITNNLYYYGSQSSSADPYSSFYPPMIILLIVSVIMICVLGSSLNEQPAPEIKIDDTESRSVIPSNDKHSIDAESWTCPRCGTVNANSRFYCYECSERRPSDKRELPPSDKICPFCGAKMAPNLSICWNCKKPYQPNITSKNQQTKTCGFCGATINFDAKFCEKCGKSTKSPNPETIAETKQAETENTKSKTKICDECGAIISSDGKFCGKCGKPIKAPVPPKKTKNICSCGAEIPVGNRFCGICGKPVPIDHTCRKCGTKIPLGNNFCGICGEKVDSD